MYRPLHIYAKDCFFILEYFDTYTQDRLFNSVYSLFSHVIYLKTVYINKTADFVKIAPQVFALLYKERNKFHLNCECYTNCKSHVDETRGYKNRLEVQRITKMKIKL